MIENYFEIHKNVICIHFNYLQVPIYFQHDRIVNTERISRVVSNFYNL